MLRQERHPRGPHDHLQRLQHGFSAVKSSGGVYVLLLWCRTSTYRDHSQLWSYSTHALLSRPVMLLSESVPTGQYKSMAVVSSLQSKYLLEKW